jgi:hypothetical protein
MNFLQSIRGVDNENSIIEKKSHKTFIAKCLRQISNSSSKKMRVLIVRADINEEKRLHFAELTKKMFSSK